MKKVLSIVAVAALTVAFLSCGASKEEMAAKQKQTLDSLAADSITKADAEAAEIAAERAQFLTDSTATADREKFVADSTASATPAKKGGKKP